MKNYIYHIKRHRLLTKLAFFIFFISLCNYATAKPNYSQIAAIVNSDVISKHDVNTRIKFLNLTSGIDIRETEKIKFRSFVLSQLIQERLKLQEMKRNRIIVTRKNLQAAIALMEKKNKLSKGQLLSDLEKNNVDPRTFSAQVEISIGWNELMRRKLIKLGNIENKIIDDQIQLLKNNIGKPEYLLSEIFVPNLTDKNETNTEIFVNKIFSQANTSIPFAQLAQSFSQSASAKSGGQLGWVSEDQINQAFKSALSNAKPNTILNPIKIEAGYYILKLHGKRLSKGFDATRTKVWLYQLFFPLGKSISKKDIESQISLVETVSQTAENCLDMKKIGEEIGNTNAGKIDGVRLKDLAPLVRNLTNKLDVGKIATPIRTKNGILLIMLCDRKVENDEFQIRKKIRENLIRKKIALISRQTMLDLERSGFIEVRQ